MSNYGAFVTSSVDLPIGYVRDGVTDPTNLLKVNADGSISATSTQTGTAVANQVTVTTSATLIVAANPTRLSLQIANDTTTDAVWIGFTSSLTTASSSHRIAAGVSTQSEQNIPNYTGAVYGVATTSVKVSYIDIG